MGHVHADGVEAVPGNAGVAYGPVEIEEVHVAERQALQPVCGSLKMINSEK